jgi:hypothetical protein
LGPDALCRRATGCSGSHSDSATGARKASITFQGRDPGRDAVAAFDKNHTDIKITHRAVRPGDRGRCPRTLNAVQAANAPFLARVGYETLPCSCSVEVWNNHLLAPMVHGADRPQPVTVGLSAGPPVMSRFRRRSSSGRW